MALYEIPIRRVFAATNGYTLDELEKINQALDAQYVNSMIIDQSAEAILCALGPYQRPTPGRGWRPRHHTTETPWRSRLEAYVFGTDDAEKAGHRFTTFSCQLHAPEPDYIAIANNIFQWGRVQPRAFSANDIKAVREAAMSGQIPELPTPWSSSFTKIAAATTYRDDINPASKVLPQVIWDSRVSFSVTRLASNALANNQELLNFLKGQILVVPGRGGNRQSNAEGSWTDGLRAQGWKFAIGSWQTRSNSFWRSQIAGSQLIHAMAGKLNTFPQFEAERREGHRWTSFDVALALFVEGY